MWPLFWRLPWEENTPETWDPLRMVPSPRSPIAPPARETRPFGGTSGAPVLPPTPLTSR